MDTATIALLTNHFDDLPDEILEKIFFSINYPLPLIPNNHVRLESNSYYFDYSIQQPLLKKAHAELLPLLFVCRRFYKIIKPPSFWERKCRQEHVILPDQHFPSDFTAYEKTYVNDPFHPVYNLLEDKKWTKSRNTDAQVQLVPIGSHPLYDEFNRLSPCRATSYTSAEFFQRNVQLPYSGSQFDDFVILRPVIEFSICVAGRWDCGSQCSISLEFSDGHKWKDEKRIPQWNDQKWHRIIYRYAQYEQFPSSVTVHFTGSDTQFWAGYYGIKFAQARVRFLLGTNENNMNEEREVVIEPKADDELALVQTPDVNAFPDDLPIDENSRSPSVIYDSDEYSMDEDEMYD